MRQIARLVALASILALSAPHALASGKKKAASKDAEADVATTKRSREPSVLVRLLPFGAGLYASGSPVLGTGAALIQAGGLYLWYSSNKTADETVDETNAYVAESHRNFGEQNENMTFEDRENFEAFIGARETMVNDARSRATYGLYAFAGTWILSSAWTFIAPELSAHAATGPMLMPASEPRALAYGWSLGLSL